MFLRIFVGGQEIDGFHVTEVDVVAEEEDEKEFADVLFLLIPVEGLVALELGPDVGQLLVDALHLRLFALAVADVGNEDGQTAHSVALYRRHRGFVAGAGGQGSRERESSGRTGGGSELVERGMTGMMMMMSMKMTMMKEAKSRE